MSDFQSFKTKIQASGSGLLNRAKAKDIGSQPTHSRIGLVTGLTGLGISLANYRNNSVDRQANRQRLAMEQKSVSALNKIHSALTKEHKNFE